MMSQATYGSMICALSVPLISVCFLTAVVPTDCSFAGSPPALINADGVKDGKKPKYTNLLIKETSPYLLMHAHNPVDWYPWGQKAFAKAKKEGKLVFLSIGYSSCYWCHVMERKCFENEKIAKLLNKYFVSIKVDREERPDIDKVYMTAYQVSSERGGGWPLSMFLLPDGRPLGGGTYIPPEPFTELLKRVAKLNKEEKAKLEKTGDLLAKFTKSNLEQSERAVRLGALDRTRVKACMDSLVSRFDSKYGGFGSPPDFAAPKFPTPCQLEFVFYEVNRAAKKRIDKEAKGQLKMLTLTLDKMALGGIYDQLGGGFHRYSTERTWTVPHFEKMLYDNGQLVEIYSKAYSLTQKPLYKRVVKETIEYLKREMLSSEGALYSSQDAETGRKKDASTFGPRTN
ncbi:MAG: thioredoxin domain-containing protein [Gemmataceae bacterium]